jgi:glucose-6-phosphate 1-dehydrogenase
MDAGVMTTMSERLSDPQALAKSPPAPPCTLVIFGASGDLTKRLLMPSLYNLRLGGLLGDGFEVIGVDHNERSEDDYRQYLTQEMESFVGGGGEFSPSRLDMGAWDWLRDHIHYQVGDFADSKLYEALAQRLKGNAVFYLAVAARFFGPVVGHLADAGLMKQKGGAFRRVVIEKPFGNDLASAKALNTQILAKVSEGQVFRIDHFLGKETVQNIMALRFSNGIFEPLWNRQYIDSVQITAAEIIGVEDRARFYEPTGALRDMVPNHMFQLLSMVAMEAPNSFDADAVRDEKAKVVEAIKPFTPDRVLRDTVRGQYTGGTVPGLGPVRGYREEPDVAPDSVTETYVALRLKIDNWRWAGVPFYIRTGKRMAKRRTEIAVVFKSAPYALFRDTPVDRLTRNKMLIHVQPDEGITLDFSAKIPGPALNLGRVAMDFRYKDYFKLPSSTGYETLLYDVMTGDATLFQRADNIEAGWAAVQPLLDTWAEKRGTVNPYFAGSTGPEATDWLLSRDGRRWLSLGE